MIHNFCRKIIWIGVFGLPFDCLSTTIYYHLKSFNKKLEFVFTIFVEKLRRFLIYAGKFRRLGCLENMSSDVQMCFKKNGIYIHIIAWKWRGFFLKHWNLDFYNFCKKIRRMGVFEKMQFGLKIYTGKLRGWGCFNKSELWFKISAGKLYGWGCLEKL